MRQLLGLKVAAGGCEFLQKTSGTKAAARATADLVFSSIETSDRRLSLWRSPADQPAWARPTLLAIALVAALAYGWGMAGASIEPYYGAAARSMSQSWHDFIFGAFDPAGTVTVDKLPGALWVQALSLRVFGFHIWAIVLPQVIEGVLTVLVLYRAIRRLAGPLAGLTGAAVLAVTPVTVLLGRGNVSDSLLILLLVLAADATSAALLSGSLRQLLVAGLWVGLAFQAKMIQAWLVLPALAAAYLVAAPAKKLRVRCAHVALAGLVTAVVSLAWMTAVSLVPSHDRPYADGSGDNSMYTQVFDYNGVGRLTGNWATVAGPPSPILVAARENGHLLNAETFGIKASWHRLLGGPFGADGGWLLPAAAVGALGVLISRRGRDRRDPLRAAVVLWGAWWLITALFFSTGTYINSYYVAALVPAVAALCGAGVAACGPPPWSRTVRLIMAATVLGCLGYGAYLMSGTVTGPAILTAIALVIAVSAAVQLLLPASGLAGNLTAAAFACAAILLLPAAASVNCVIRELGPFDTPFESAATAHNNQALAAAAPSLAQAARHMELAAPPGDALFGADTSGLAADFILFSGREVLPIGGFLGNVPAPTLAVLRADIRRDYVRVFVLPVSPAGKDPRVLWLESHCGRQPPIPGHRPVPYANFICGGILRPVPVPKSQPVPG
ncbi:MAG TPA: glycosyltransferase family 39 protein [Streptosporangiaceae bacterium]|nr:glycosyltransferase family 39 protein [Streptosporangiaceae bacterium]